MKLVNLAETERILIHGKDGMLVLSANTFQVKQRGPKTSSKSQNLIPVAQDI
jgi:hypothetical protein